MFNIGFGEILIVLVVAFVIVGPDDLPKVARWLGRGLRKLRLLMRDIKRETGLDELEKEVKDVQRDVRATVRELDVSQDLRDAVKDVKAEVDGLSRDVDRDIKRLDQDMKAEARALNSEVRDAVNQVDAAAAQVGRCDGGAMKGEATGSPKPVRQGG